MQKQPYSEALENIYALIITRFKTVVQYMEDMHTPEGILTKCGSARACFTTPFPFDVEVLQNNTRQYDIARHLTVPSDADGMEEMKKLLSNLATTMFRNREGPVVEEEVEEEKKKKEGESDILKGEKNLFLSTLVEVITDERKSENSLGCSRARLGVCGQSSVGMWK